MNAFNWFAAWLLFLLILAAIAQTRWGRTIFYYLLWLAVLFLLLSHYEQITSILTGGANKVTGGAK